MAAGETPSEAAGALIKAALARAASTREAASEEAMGATGATIGAEALGAGRHEAAGEVRQLSSLCRKQQLLHTRGCIRCVLAQPVQGLHSWIQAPTELLKWHPMSCYSVMLMLATTRPLCWLLPAVASGDAVTAGRRVLWAGQLHGRLQGDAQRRAALLPRCSQKGLGCSWTVLHMQCRARLRELKSKHPALAVMFIAAASACRPGIPWQGQGSGAWL